ncbi:MAG TPA: isoprenylcysteine carboxylmethyltransferase family protein [Gemmatimonadales bacterium]|nr:isoprenylcysteine carboxylmethyltransferase family protein [Gemmatimonadales bacterium]
MFLPARVLRWSGIVGPVPGGVLGVAGVVAGAAGAGLAVWCVLTFALVGKGTPAPFDPPRRLVARGPYGVVRNPMYVGAGLALAGAALVYRSVALLGFAAAFLVVCHLFVLVYEEPTLRRMFGGEYQDYCNRVGRWWPRRFARRAVGAG